MSNSFHRLKIVNETGNPSSHMVNLFIDGNPIYASRLELTLSALPPDSTATAVITIPLVLLDVDLPADIAIIDGPVGAA
jgi:hypothetical protein